MAAILEKAILLYGLSLSLQESELAPISNVYMMALCNNIGQCHASLLRQGDAQRWNERLLRLMVCDRQTKSSNSDDDDAHDKPHDCECFFYNTMSLILQDPCVSPAA